MRNRLLLFGTLVAQLVHIGALYTPGLSTVLRVEPVSFKLWLTLLGVALSILVRVWLAPGPDSYAKGCF